MKNNLNFLGIVIMLMSSLFTCGGQLFWKLFSIGYGVLFFLGGFALYGCGAILMITALRFGELSRLHPMLGTGYILSLILGVLVLKEQISISRIVGIIIIILGLICLNFPERNSNK